MTGEGIDELIDTLAQHRDVAFGTEFGRTRQLAIARFRLQKTAENLLLEGFDRASAAEGPELASALQRRESDPYTLAKALVVSSLKREYGDELAAERAA